MTDEEVQALRDELKDANDSIEALSNKNREVILKNKKLSSQNSEINSDDHYKVLDENDSLKEQIKKLNHDIKGREKDIAKLSDSNNSLNGNLQSLLIDGGLSDNLSKVGVLPQYMDATKALLRSQVSIIDNKAVVGEKPLNDFMTEWAGDGGKAFIKAPDSSGGGGQGGQGSGNTDVKKYFDKTGSDFNLTKQAEVFKTDPALYAQLSK